MDRKLSNAVAVLDALESYFESLETYIKQTDRTKYDKVEAGITKCREYRKKFEILKGETGDEALFQFVHLHQSMRVLLNDLYTSLDFELPVGEEISKTRAYRLTEVFDKITKIYRTYIRDVAAEASSIITHAATVLKSTNPLDIQKYWQKWPNSIDLYTLAMTTLLDKSYHEKDNEKRQLIFEIIESDKRFILNEQEWLSPFLTFNCVPHVATPVPMAWPALAEKLAEIAPDVKWRGAGVVEGADASAPGVILVEREQDAGVVHVLPRGLTWGPGITDDDMQTLLRPVMGTKWKWDIKVTDTPATARYVIVERMGDDYWRVLVPWKYPRALVDKNVLVYKIKERAFGRPNAYHENLERPLRHMLSRRVATLSSEEARNHDVSLSVLRVTDQLMAEVKRGKGPADRRLENDKLDKIFEAAVLEELSHHNFRLKDAIFYWADWMRRSFRKDLDAQVEKLVDAGGNDLKEWTAILENQVEKAVHAAVSGGLRKTDNVFKDLFDMEHKLNEVQMHTRRDF